MLGTPPFSCHVVTQVARRCGFKANPRCKANAVRRVAVDDPFSQQPWALSAWHAIRRCGVCADSVRPVGRGWFQSAVNGKQVIARFAVKPIVSRVVFTHAAQPLNPPGSVTEWARVGVLGFRDLTLHAHLASTFRTALI